MNIKFGIVLKKLKGHERINELLINLLESDGWSADRNFNSKYIMVRSSKAYNKFKNRLDLVRRLNKLIDKNINADIKSSFPIKPKKPTNIAIRP